MGDSEFTQWFPPIERIESFEGGTILVAPEVRANIAGAPIEVWAPGLSAWRGRFRVLAHGKSGRVLVAGPTCPGIASGDVILTPETGDAIRAHQEQVLISAFQRDEEALERTASFRDLLEAKADQDKH